MDNRENAQNVLMILGLPVLTLLLVAASLPIGLFNAWVSQKLYGWFLLPLGLPALNLWHVYGLVITYRLIDGFDTSEKKQPPFLARTGAQIIGALLILLLAYIIKDHIGY